MAAITFTCILLANIAQGNTAFYSALTSFPDVSAENLFALQIRHSGPTAETPQAVLPGNNLNDVGGTSSKPDEPEEIATSTKYSEDNEDKKNNDGDRGNVHLFPIEANTSENKVDHLMERQIDEVIEKPLRLVWDTCVETTFRDGHRNIVKADDMEISNSDFQPEDLKELKPPKPLSEISTWKKRDASQTNFTMNEEPWLGNFGSLKSSKTEGRRPQRPESILVTKITESFTNSTESVPTTTVQMIPITREIFKMPEIVNVSQKAIVTEISVKASYTEDWFEVKDRGEIRFSGLPQKETYLIPALKLEEGFHPFAFMSDFFTVIYPFDFPSIKLESTFLAFIIAFVCISLVIPSYLIILGILALFSKSRCDDETETGALFPEAEESDCNDRALVVMTLFVVLICCVFISGMAVSNEQAHEAAMESRNVLHCACADVAAWLVAAARELHHSIIPPVDLVLHAYREDLKNIEVLLGEPIQQAIASESGIELVFDSLADIISESEDLATKISALRDVSIKGGGLAAAASDRIKDLGRQLENLKKFCNAKDAPLCDTVNTNNLELQIKFELILREKQLLDLRALGVHNLTRAIATARREFKTLPNAIVAQTIEPRKDILNDIETRRQAVHTSADVLNDIVRTLTTGLHNIARQIEAGLDRVQRYDFWRWTLMLICVVTFGFIMLLIMCAMMCGCGHAKDHGKRTLQVSAVFMSFSSLILWSVISAIFLIAGHAELYVCHALWDKPQYATLTALLDRPSPLLPNDEGIFDALFRDIENVTIDVSIKDILRDCEKDRPAYIVFQLDKVLDVNKETSYFEWGELQADLGRLSSSIDVGLLKTVSQNFNRLLNGMLVVSDVNLAKYRMDYNAPIVGKDLPSLVEQLQNVAAQVSDLTTAGRLETMATRTKRLYTSSIKPLEQVRADVVFKLTELELQLLPFRRKLNISLSHIHTAQYYIDNQGDVIAQKKVSMYISRLISHAAAWRTHVLMSVGKHAGRCKPLFAVYSALRTLLCSKYISSLHGWWFCGVLLGALWCSALTPLCVRLWRTYGWKIRAHEAMHLTNLSGPPQSTPTTAMCDGSNWNTPGDCEKDRPAYIVFQLDKVLDVNKETSYFEWGELQADLGRLSSSIDVGLLKTVSQNFNRLLNGMLVVSDVNLAKYRMDYNAPIVGKDLPSLVEQLQNVAAQVSDLTTAGRLETMATRTKRLYTSSIKPLEQVRADVVFKLTELELQLLPFRRKLNISLSHIHTAQYYIDNQGDVIAQKKVSMYISRLISHAAAWRTHVLMSVGKHAGRCKPLFAVYSALRTLLCSKYISSLHGWWFCGVLLGALWCSALTPLCVRLWRTYGWKIRAHEAMHLTNLSGPPQSTPTTAMCDGSNWNTPGPPPAPRSDSW